MSSDERSGREAVPGFTISVEVEGVAPVGFELRATVRALAARIAAETEGAALDPDQPLGNVELLARAAGEILALAEIDKRRRAGSAAPANLFPISRAAGASLTMHKGAGAPKNRSAAAPGLDFDFSKLPTPQEPPLKPGSKRHRGRLREP